MAYCPACGRYYLKKHSKCTPRSIGAINAAHTRALKDSAFPTGLALEEQLKDGFNMLSDDEVVSFNEERELEGTVLAESTYRKVERIAARLNAS